ncbi:MAG: metallophosphoesterase [Lachnospiraceae bacterium]
MEENFDPCRRAVWLVILCILSGAAGLWYSIRVGRAMELVLKIPCTPFLAGCILFLLLVQLVSDNTKRETFSGLYRVLVWLSGLAVAILVYGGMTMILLDAAFFLIRHLTVFRPSYAAAAGISLIVGVFFTLFGVIRAKQITTTRYALTTKKPCGRCRVVQLSDLHLGAVVGTGQVERIVRAVNACEPDLVVITGDLFNHGRVGECKDPEKAAKLLSGIRSTWGVYAVTGNHDPMVGEKNFSAFLERSGIRLLHNTCVSAGPFFLCGRVGNRLRGRTPLDSFFDREGSPGSYSIILDHYPDGSGEASEVSADLFLAGHTHKGQYFPCGLLIRGTYRGGMLYGHSKKGGTDCIVSSGAGYFQIPIRVGTRSEVVCIDLAGSPRS